MSVAFSSDGRTLVSAGGNTIRLWNIGDPDNVSERQTLSTNTDNIMSVAFSSDGKTLASAGGNTIQLWNVEDPDKVSEERTLTGPPKTHFFSVAFSNDGRTLASGGSDTIRLWDVGDPAALSKELRGHTQPVYSVAFNLAGETLVSASQDKTVRLWDVRDPTNPVGIGQQLLQKTGPVFSVAFSRDDVIAMGGEDGGIRLWDVGNPAYPVLLHENAIRACRDIRSVSIDREARLIASAGDDEKPRAWGMEPGNGIEARPNCAGVFDGQDAKPKTTAVAYNNERGILASGGTVQGISLWGVAEHGGLELAGRVSDTNLESVRSVAFSTDGRVLAIGGRSSEGKGVQLWNISDLSHPVLLWKLPGHGDTTSVAISSEEALWSDPGDGRTIRIASSGDDETVRIWNIHVSNDLEPMDDSVDPIELKSISISATASTVWSVAFSHDGRFLAGAGGDDGAVRLWDLRTIDEEGVEQYGPPLRGFNGRAITVAFDPTGRLLASAGSDGSTYLRSASNPVEVVQPLDGHGSTVWSISFSHSPWKMVAGGADGIVRVWDLDPATIIDHICKGSSVALSEAMWKEYGLPKKYYKEPCD